MLKFLALAAAVGLLGCSAKEYECMRAQECVAKEGGFGMCLEGHCAFLDPTCPLEWPWRFDEAAGDLAGECASRPLEDAGGGVDRPADAGAGL